MRADAADGQRDPRDHDEHDSESQGYLVRGRQDGRKVLDLVERPRAVTRDQGLLNQVRGGFDLARRADRDVKRVDSLPRLEVFHDRDRDQHRVSGDLGLSQRVDAFAEYSDDGEFQSVDLDRFTDGLP